MSISSPSCAWYAGLAVCIFMNITVSRLHAPVLCSTSSPDLKLWYVLVWIINKSNAKYRGLPLLLKADEFTFILCMCAPGCSCHMRNVSPLEYFTHVSIRITTFAECRLPVSKIQVLFAIVAAIVNRQQNTIIDSCKSYVLKKVYARFPLPNRWKSYWAQNDVMGETKICIKTRLWWWPSDVRRKTRLK